VRRRGGGAEVVARSFAETIGLTTDDEAGLVYVSILGGEIRMVLMSHARIGGVTSRWPPTSNTPGGGRMG
jgi:hypothetical protein